MPPLLTAGNLDSNSLPSPSCTITSTDTLEDMLHGLNITSPCSRTSSPSLAPASSSTSSPPPSSRRAEKRPLVYTHVRNLHGIISSNYYRTPTSRVEDLAQSLGALAAQYLASHGYGTSDVTTIVQIYRQARNNDQFILDLARCGMSIAEAKFLLVLIAQHDQ